MAKDKKRVKAAKKAWKTRKNPYYVIKKKFGIVLSTRKKPTRKKKK